MLLNERFQNSKKLLNGAIPVGGNKSSGAKMTNGLGNSTGVSGNKISTANDLTKGMGNSIGVAGKNNIVGFDRKPEIKKTGASGDGRHFTPAELVKTYEQKQAEQANSLKQKQENLNTRTGFTTENNRSQTTTQPAKRQEYSGIQSIVAKPVIQKQVQPQYIPTPNNISNSQPIQTAVQTPLGVGQNQFFNNQTESLTKNITAAQVGTGGQKSYGVGAGNVNNDPSFSVGQNVNSLVNDNTSSRFTGGNIQNVQPFNQPAPLVNSATQTQFNEHTTPNPNPTSQSQSVQPQNIVQVGQQSQNSTLQVSSNDPLSRGYIPRTEKQVNSLSPVAFFDSTQTSVPVANSTNESKTTVVIPVGQQSQYSENKISSDDPLSKGFLAQSQSSKQSPIENIQKEKVFGIGENQATQSAKSILDNSNTNVIEDLSVEPILDGVVSDASAILTKDQIIDRILRETVITIASNCRNVTENYLVDIGFEFPTDIEDKTASLNFRAKIGREKDFSSSLIRKDPAGKWYALVDIGALGNSSGGFREILLDLGKSQAKDELFSNQPKPGVYLTKADYSDPKYKENLDNHNYAVSVQRGEKYGSTATKEKYELYKKIAKETKLSKQTKSEFKSKEPIELFLEMPKLGETERIPKTLRIVVDDEGGVQYLVQIDTSNPNPDYFKYSVNLGSRIYNEKRDKLFLSLVAPADVTGQREEFWKFEKIRTIRILSEESKVKGASSDSSESETLKNFKEVGSKVNITPGQNNKDVIKVGQSSSKSKVIGLTGALGLSAIAGAANTNNALNSGATANGQTNYSNSENKTSTADYQSSSTSSQGTNRNQNRQSSSQTVPIGNQSTSTQRQTYSSSKTNQNSQNQGSANQPLGSAARPPSVIPIDPNLPTSVSKQVNSSIPVGGQSVSSQPQNIGANQFNQGSQSQAQKLGQSVTTLGSAARPPNAIPTDPYLPKGIGNKTINSIPVGGQSLSQPQTTGANQFNRGSQNQNFNKPVTNLGSVNSNQPSSNNANFGEQTQNYTPSQLLNKLRNSSLVTSQQFGSKNLPNSGVISAPYQFANNISSASINSPQNPGQTIQYGGINKDRPLIDAKGNPIPIRNNNTGPLRTGLSATITTTDTILGVATAGILPANSIGRANSPISTNSSNSTSDNSEYPTQNQQNQSRANNLELNSDGGDNGNKPPNNRPPKRTGGNDDENYDDQNPEDQNEDIENNEIEDNIDSSAIVPYQDEDVDVVDGEFVDENNQPLDDNPDRPSQRLLTGKQMQELAAGKTIEELEEEINLDEIRDQVKNPNSQNPFAPNPPDLQSTIDEAKRKNFFDKLVGRARGRIPGYKDINNQKVKSETTQSNKNPLASKQEADTVPLGPKGTVGKSAAKEFVKKQLWVAFLANAWWIIPTILALILMLAFVGGIIAIECDNGKSDVRTFKTVDTIVTGVEALGKTASGDIIGGIGKALEAGIGTAEALVVYDSGLIRSDLNRFISKIPGCASPCQTQGIGVANVDSNVKIGTYDCKESKYDGIPLPGITTSPSAFYYLFMVCKIESGCNPNTQANLCSGPCVGMYQLPPRELLGECTKAKAGGYITIEPADCASKYLGNANLQTSVQISRLTTRKNASYGRYGDAPKKAGLNPQLTTLGMLLQADALLSSGASQDDYVRALEAIDIQNQAYGLCFLGYNGAVKNDGWAGARPSNAPKMTQDTDGRSNETWNEYYNTMSTCTRQQNGRSFIKGAIAADLYNKTKAGCNAPTGEATPPKTPYFSPDKFNQPIQVAKLQQAKDELNNNLSELVGFLVQYKSPSDNLKRPEMKSYGIQALDDRINEFNQILGGRVIVEALNNQPKTVTDSSEKALRDKIISYYTKGEVLQIGQYTRDIDYISNGGADLNLVKYLDALYNAGIVWVSGPKNFGRGGSSHVNAMDYWGLGYKSDFNGDKIKGFTWDGVMTGSRGTGAVPSPTGNDKDPRIFRHVDIESPNADIAKKANDIFKKAVDLAYSLGVVDTETNSTAQIFANNTFAKNNTTKEQPIFNESVAKYHHHHLHLGIFQASKKAFGSSSLQFSGTGSGASDQCCPQESTVQNASAVTITNPSNPGDANQNAGEDPDSTPPTPLPNSFLNLFQPIKASAVTVADVVEAGKKRGYTEELTISESDVVAVEGTPGGNPNPKLLKEAADKWKEMDTAAKTKGISIGVYSGFRPVTGVGGQTGIVQGKIDAGQSVEKILSASAPPGYSQHQTGRGVDINNIETSFGETPAYKWLQENAVKYGFSNTYPKGNKAGADWEPWHWFYFKGYPGYDQTTGVRNSGPKEAGATTTSGSTGSTAATGSCCPGQGGGSNSAATDQNAILNKTIEEIVKKYGGHSAVAQRVSDGKVEHYNGDQAPDNVASTIKSVVTVVVIEEQLKKLASSGVNEETSIFLPSELKGKETKQGDITFGDKISIKDAVTVMLSYSSNATTNALVYYFGGGNQTTFEDIKAPKEKFTALMVGYGFTTMAFNRYLNLNDGNGTAAEKADPNQPRNKGTALDITKAMYKVFQNPDKYKLAANALENAEDQYNIKSVAQSEGVKNVANKWGGVVGTNAAVSKAGTSNIAVFEIESKKYVVGAYINGNYKVEKNRESLRNINQDIIKLIKGKKLFGETPATSTPAPTSFLNFFQPIRASAVESPDQILLIKVDPVANTTLTSEEKAFLDMIAVKEQGKYNGSTTAGNRGKYQIAESDLTQALQGLKGAGYEATGITTSNMLEPKNQDLVAIGRILWRSQFNARNEKRKLGDILKNGDGFLIALGMASEEFQALPAITGFNSAVVDKPRQPNGFTIEVAKLYYQKMLGIYGGTSSGNTSGIGGIDCNKSGTSTGTNADLIALFKSKEFTSQSSDDEKLFAEGKYDPKVVQLILKLYNQGFQLQGGSDNYRPEKKGTSKHKTGEAYDFAAIGKKGGPLYNIKTIATNPTTGPHSQVVKEFTDAVKSSGLLNGNQLIGPNAWKSAGLVPMGTNDVVDKETGAVIGTHEDHIHVGIN